MSKKSHLWGINLMPWNARQISIFLWQRSTGASWLAIACAKPCKSMLQQLPCMRKETQVRSFGAINTGFAHKKYFSNRGKNFNIRENTEAAKRHFFATAASQILGLDLFFDRVLCVRAQQCGQWGTADPRLC